MISSAESALKEARRFVRQAELCMLINRRVRSNLRVAGTADNAEDLLVASVRLTVRDNTGCAQALNG